MTIETPTPASRFRSSTQTIASTDALRKKIDQKPLLPKAKLGELLMRLELVNKEQLHQALIQQNQQSGLLLGKLLINMEAIDERQLYQTLALKLGMHFVSLKNFDIDNDVLDCLTFEQALKHNLLPLMRHKGRLVMATSNPNDDDNAKIAAFITGQTIDFVIAMPSELSDAINRYYGIQQEEEDINQLASKNALPYRATNNDATEMERLSKEQPIVRLVQHMLIDAVRKKASDIHVRPGEHKVDLIFRIDGSLVHIKSFDRCILPGVVSRIKILSGMDISEHRVAQDGRSTITTEGKTIDLRVSIMPTVNGESVVIRLLDTSGTMSKLDDLGFEENDLNLLVNILNKSCGILLVTGPTGSGKSTTLYSALSHIRERNVNIITVENPVEYHIDGIEQMQVNEKVGYTFSRILRNILRHDPDVIMIGEIRDQETAKIAIESALTGHFVLSTLHTNSASATVSRLLEMGIEPYLISDTLLGVLAQRLIRKNCPVCIAKEHVEPHVYAALGVHQDETYYRGQGCEQCNFTGYKGRHAVYELLTASSDLRTLINQSATADNIQQQAIACGMRPLTQNALHLAQRKVTSLAEVYRVRLQ